MTQPEASPPKMPPTREETPESELTLTECRRVFSPIPFLSALSDDDLNALLPLLCVQTFAEGETIFHEDDASNGVCFVAEGTVEIFKSDINGHKLPLVVLSEYGVFGEMGLLSGAARTATARATTAGRLLCLTNDGFYEALDGGMLPAYRMVLAFARVLSQRLSSMDEKLFVLFNTEDGSARFHELDELRHRLLTSWIV